MTEAATAPAPEQRVEVVSGDGRRGTIVASDIPALEKSGGRVLTPADLAEERTSAAYEKQSTLQKVATVASMAGPVGYPLHAYLRTHGAELPPTLGAYQEGVGTGFTGGLSELGLKEATRAVGGDAVAKAYVQGVDDLKAAHPTAYGAGVVAGIGGSIAAGNAGAAGKIASPIGAGASLVGNVVERGAARAVAGLAERGVAGKALAAAARLGARGAAEGAIYGAATETTDQLIHDHDLAAEKIYGAAGTGALGGLVGGAALGGVGSLVGSAGSGIARVIGRKGAEAEAEASAKAAGEGGADAAAEAPTAGVADQAIESSVSGVENNYVRQMANRSAFRSISVGGLSPTKWVKKAQKFLPNGADDVGETLLRRGILNADDPVLQTALSGTPERLLPKIEAESTAVGKRLGEIADASGAQVPAKVIQGAIDSVVAPLEKKAGFGGIAGSVREYGTDLLDKLGIKPPPLPADIGTYPPTIQKAILEKLTENTPKTVSVQSLLEQRKALDDLIWREGQPLTASPRIEELRSLRGKIEDVITEALDAASDKAPGELKAEYKGLKRDYFALQVAQNVAQDSVSRAAKNSHLGLTDKMVGTAVGVTSHAIGIPGIVAGPAAAYASKIVRERGQAAAAVLLSRMADAGIVTRAQQSVDAAVARASKGMLVTPKAATPAAVRDLIPRAQRIVQDVRAAQTNPQAYIDRVTKQAEPLASTTPGVANSYTATLTRAAAFMASKIPETPPTDPLDPHAPPMLTHDQADKIVTYGTYVNQPMRFLDDLSKGVFSFEGAEVLQTLMPKTFAELQASTAQGLAELRAQGKQIPYWQTEKLGLLLDFPATPAQRPDHIAFLQSQIAAAQAPPTPNQAIGGSGGAKPPRRPMPTRSTTSNVLDRLAESGPGRT